MGPVSKLAKGGMNYTKKRVQSLFVAICSPFVAGAGLCNVVPHGHHACGGVYGRVQLVCRKLDVTLRQCTLSISPYLHPVCSLLVMTACRLTKDLMAGNLVRRIPPSRDRDRSLDSA